MPRRRRKNLSWYEPLCFNRRRTLRSLLKLRWMFIRVTLYGLITGAISHFIVWQYNLPLPLASWQLYAFATGIVPTLILASMFSFILPRTVKLHPKWLLIQDGQHAARIEYDTIQNHRIGLLPSQPELAYLAITKTNQRGKRSITIVGISPKVDLVTLDRQLHARRRFWQHKRRRT